MRPFLLETIAWPAAFEVNDRTRQALVIVLLKHLCTCAAVVLVDRERLVAQDLSAAIWVWPDSDRRQQAMALLDRLDDLHRVIGTSVGVTGSTACEHVHDLSRQVGDTCTAVVPESCGCGKGWCGRSDLGQSVADFLLRDEWSQSAPHPPMDLAAFQQQIWQPWFAHTRTLVLVDRNLGRNAARKHGLDIRWTRSLRWIVQCFSEHAYRADFPGPRITIFTGSGLSSPDLDKLKTRLRELQATLNQGFPPDFIRIVLKEEQRRVAEMPHARYLRTDQGIWRIENGLDVVHWTRSDAVVENFIATLDDRAWEEVEREFSDLRDLDLQ